MNVVVRRRAAIIAFVLACGSAQLTWPVAIDAATPVGKPVDSGAVRITDPYDESKAVTHGGAETEFTVRPPAGATCPGDSANDQWRVQSFIIPSTDDPAQIQYGAIGPEPVGNGRYALFEVNTEPFVHQLTVRNPVAGMPGVIAAVPPLSFEVIAGQHIPGGTYRMGIACTYFGATALYWDTDVVLTEGTDNKVGSFRWRLASEPASVNRADDDSSTSAAAIVGIAIAVLIVAAGCFVLIRRRRVGRLIILSKESS